MVDPGFPVVEGACTCWGCAPLTWVLFGENVHKNERIGSHTGGMRPARPLDPPMQCFFSEKHFRTLAAKEPTIVEENNSRNGHKHSHYYRALLNAIIAKQ